MKRRVNILLVVTAIFLVACKQKTPLIDFVEKINQDKWEKSTLRFFKEDCDKVNTKVIRDNSYFISGDTIPLNVNGESVTNIEEHIVVLMKSRKELLEALTKNESIEVVNDKLFISDFHQYNQARPYFIVYSEMEKPYIVEYNFENKEYRIDRFSGAFKGYGVDHSTDAKEIKCRKNLDGTLRNLEIFTKIYLKKDELVYETRYMFLGT